MSTPTNNNPPLPSREADYTRFKTFAAYIFVLDAIADQVGQVFPFSTTIHGFAVDNFYDELALVTNLVPTTDDDGNDIGTWNIW